MAEYRSPELTQGQIKALERLFNAGFQFTSLEHITRHLVIEKSGFMVLLDPTEGKLRLFGQVGYRVGDGIGMLIGQPARPAFVWKKKEVAATPELLAAYQRVKAELAELLNIPDEL